MASTIPFIFGTNAQADTWSNVKTAIDAMSNVNSKRVLVIFADDIKGAMTDGNTETIESGEDWLSAILYNAEDVSIADEDNQATSGRRFNVESQGRDIDEGRFLTGVDLSNYSLRVNFYSSVVVPTRPTLASL